MRRLHVEVLLAAAAGPLGAWLLAAALAALAYEAFASSGKTDRLTP